MGYYADLIKEKQNSKNGKYPHIQKECDIWIVLYAEGTKSKEFDTEDEAKRFAKTVINEKEESYYAKLSEEKASKKNAEGKIIFKVMGEEFDISTVGGMKKAAEAIEYHFKRKRDELGLPTAEQWKAKIGHELLLKSRER